MKIEELGTDLVFAGWTVADVGFGHVTWEKDGAEITVKRDASGITATIVLHGSDGFGEESVGYTPDVVILIGPGSVGPMRIARKEEDVVSEIETFVALLNYWH